MIARSYVSSCRDERLKSLIKSVCYGANGDVRKLANSMEWWPGAESNCRHEDFQSTALPTELPGRNKRGWERRYCSGVIISVDKPWHGKSWSPSLPWSCPTKGWSQSASTVLGEPKGQSCKLISDRFQMSFPKSLRVIESSDGIGCNFRVTTVSGFVKSWAA